MVVVVDQVGAADARLNEKDSLYYRVNPFILVGDYKSGFPKIMNVLSRASSLKKGGIWLVYYVWDRSVFIVNKLLFMLD